MTNCNINHYNNYEYFPHCGYISEDAGEWEIERVWDVYNWLMNTIF